MSIELECVNIIIPIQILRKKCLRLGDVDQFLYDRTVNGIGYWRDDYLYREGAMDSMDAQRILNSWKREGLKLAQRKRGELQWCDLCIVDISGPTLPCPWLKYDAQKHIAWHKNQEQ